MIEFYQIPRLAVPDKRQHRDEKCQQKALPLLQKKTSDFIRFIFFGKKFLTCYFNAKGCFKIELTRAYLKHFSFCIRAEFPSFFFRLN